MEERQVLQQSCLHAEEASNRSLQHATQTAQAREDKVMAVTKPGDTLA